MFEDEGLTGEGVRMQWTQWMWAAVCAAFVVGFVVGRKFQLPSLVRVEVKFERRNSPARASGGSQRSRRARGQRLRSAATQTPRDPRITKKRSEGTDSTPQSSDSSEVERRLLGFPYWHRRDCVDLREYEQVRERARLDEDAWAEHRLSVGACITDRAPWSRYRVEHCPSIGVCPWARMASEGCRDRERREREQEEEERDFQRRARDLEREEHERQEREREFERIACETYDPSCEQPSD